MRFPVKAVTMSVVEAGERVKVYESDEITFVPKNPFLHPTLDNISEVNIPNSLVDLKEMWSFDTIAVAVRTEQLQCSFIIKDRDGSYIGKGELK